MRDRTSSLDGFSQFEAKAILKNLSQLTGDRDRNRCRSMDSKSAAEGDSFVSKSMSGTSKGTQEPVSACNPCSTLKTLWPLQESLPPNVPGLTSSSLFKQKVEKLRYFYQDQLFQPESRPETVAVRRRINQVSAEIRRNFSGRSNLRRRDVLLKRKVRWTHCTRIPWNSC